MLNVTGQFRPPGGTLYSLLPLAEAEFCSPPKPKEASAEAKSKKSAVAEHDGSDDDVVAVPGGLHNPEVEKQLNEYLCKLTGDG